MPATPLTLMAVHAHPDDEATSTGGVLAKAASEGVRTVLVTCTDGRCGDGPGGIKPGDPGHDPAAVVQLRRGELERSARILDVAELELLGYGDSGMMGWSTNDAPGAFWSVPVDLAALRLANLMTRYRPDVVVTYDPNGFYGHPDHIQAHRITMAALDLLAEADRPAKVYWTTMPRSQFDRFGELLAELGRTPPAGEGLPDEVGLPDDEVSTWVDIRQWAGQKFDALEAHSSQSENIMFLELGRDRFADWMGRETFVRVADTTGAPLPESDLLDGLR